MSGEQKTAKLDRMMKVYYLGKKAEMLLKKYGITSNIPRHEFERVSEETGYEDAMVAAVCEELDQMKNNAI